MDVLRKPSWYVPALLFLLHQVAQYGFGLNHWLVDGYLDPLLCFPVLLGLLLVERRFLFGRARLGPLETVASALVLMVIFEYVFPALKDKFFYDPYDVLAYALGVFYFYAVINPRAPE